MKNFIAKLKSANYKQLLVDHGEKGVFGVVGLFALSCLATTSWSRYDKTPEQFLVKVDEGKKNIQASAWTPERAKEYSAPRNISDEVQKLHSPIDVSRYEYTTHWYWPMYPQLDRVKSPRWLEPTNAIADAGRFIMVETPADNSSNLMTGVVEGADGKAKTGDAADDENAPRRAGDDTAPRAPGVGAPATGGLAPAGAGAKGAGRGGPGALSGAGVEGAYGGEGYGGIMGGGASPAANINARGVRFVAIRSLFPLKDQVDELVKAMHETPDKAATLIQFLDFEIERQVAVVGKSPWSGPWEKVDVQSALDILDRVDFDTELVDVAYTDPVFTMPLPRRVAGKWTKFASHPKIKQLDDLNAKVQEELMRKAVEEAEKQQKEDKTRPRGFAEKQHNARGIRNQMRGSNVMGGFGKEVGTSMMESGGYGSGPGDSNALMGAVNTMTNDFQRTNTLTMKYLLFRYFDFSIVPGNAYRYRMRLTLMNPNFKRPVEDLVDESVAAGETRQTPWSEPTTPVFIPDEQKVFLAKVQKGRADGTMPNAAIDVFQWFAEAGTYISAKLEPLQLGQHIAGSSKTEVLRPASETLKEETVSIYTGNVLTDIAAAPIVELDPTEHADLKVDAKKLKQIGTVDRALVVDRFGQLMTLDPKSAADEQADSQKSLSSERKPWEHLKGKEQAAAPGGGDFSRLAGSGGAADAGLNAGASSAMMGGGYGSGGTNPLKKNSKGSSKSGAKKAKGTGVENYAP